MNSIRGGITAANECHNISVHINDGCTATPTETVMTRVFNGQLEEVNFVFRVRVSKPRIDAMLKGDCTPAMLLRFNLARKGKHLI